MMRSNVAQNNRIAPRGMDRVPTHAVTVANEQRAYARAQLQLALRILRIAGRRETNFDQVTTIDISSSGLRTASQSRAGRFTGMAHAGVQL